MPKNLFSWGRKPQKPKPLRRFQVEKIAHPRGNLRTYVRCWEIGPLHPDWDEILSRRRRVLGWKDTQFCPPGRRAHWSEDQQEVDLLFAELLQPPTHLLEIGLYDPHDRRRYFFREAFSFGCLRFASANTVATLVVQNLFFFYDQEEQSPLIPRTGLIDDLKQDWNQVACIGQILAAYKPIHRLLQ